MNILKLNQIVVVVILLLTYTNGMAQVDFGFRAGLNWTSETLQEELENSRANLQGLYSPHGQLFADVVLSQNGARFKTGLGVFQKGHRVGVSGNAVELKPIYLQVPITFGYRSQVNEGSFIFYTGPYIAFGVGGVWEVYDSGDKVASGDIAFGSAEDQDDYKSVDLGWIFELGVQVNQTFQILAYSNFGLIENAVVSEPIKVKHMTIGLGIVIVPFHYQR